MLPVSAEPTIGRKRAHRDQCHDRNFQIAQPQVPCQCGATADQEEEIDADVSAWQQILSHADQLRRIGRRYRIVVGHPARGARRVGEVGMDIGVLAGGQSGKAMAGRQQIPTDQVLRIGIFDEQYRVTQIAYGEPGRRRDDRQQAQRNGETLPVRDPAHVHHPTLRAVCAFSIASRRHVRQRLRPSDSTPSARRPRARPRPASRERSFPQDLTVIEYGCGVGRVTVPLAAIAKEVVGYDISEPHLQLARQRALALGRTNIRMVALGELPAAFEPCDVFYSKIVLQHNPPPLIGYLLRTLIRSLRRGGVGIFQVPTYYAGYRFDLHSALQSPQHSDMEMHCYPQADLFSLFADEGARLVHAREDDTPGRRDIFVSQVFVLMK
jgi:SAM-dependent methyltransferase